MENAKRNKILLEVKLEQLLFCMGKRDELKIGMIIKKKMQNGADMQTYDIQAEFIGTGSRVIPEDIIAYC